MAWVRGIREVRQITVAADEAYAGTKRGPVMTREQRLIVDLPPEAWQRVVRSGMAELPVHTGAGPCGTLARCKSGRSWLWWWSIRYLIMPLRAYYATYVPPLQFGPKTGPRGRRAA